MELYEIWKKRGGRPPKYKTAKELADKAIGYFQWCEVNPCTRKLTEMVSRPYTLDGMCVYCGISNWTDFKKYHKTDESFSRLFNELETIIRDSQVTGAMVGKYSERLVARLNGLADKIDSNVNTVAEVKIVVDDKGDADEIQRMIEK